MQTANMQPNMAMQTPPQYHYPPPMAQQHQQNYGYPPGPQQLDGFGRPISMPYGYNNMPYMAPPQANSPGYNQNFVTPYHQQSHSMSRTPSQPERPPSASQQNTPLIVSSTPQPQHSSLKPTANSFVKVPKKSAAIQIKNAAGEIIDTSTFKAPSSPAPSIQQSKTPPVVASSATPPPKPATPSHGRTDSHAAPKTAKQIQDELKEKIKQATQAPPKEDKPKEDDKSKPAEQPQTKTEDKPAEQSEAKPVETKDEPTPVAKVESETKPEPEVKAPEPAAKVEEPKKEEPKKEEPEKTAEPAKDDGPDEEEIERMIREMEEEDARREKAEEEHRKKREAEKAAAKAQADKDAVKNAAEADQKLREQEREMERLEEEKEKRRQQAEASGAPVPSIAELLSKARSGEAPESAKIESVTDKLAGMNIGGDKTAESAGPKLEKRTTKPAALNLAPLSTKPVEPAQPSAALQSLKSARFLKVIEQDIYPEGIKSPNPALNAAVQKKGKTFKYDANFLLQFQKVFTEQPSLEFHNQVKSLIGDERSRTNTPGGSGRNPSGRNTGGGMAGGPGFGMGVFQAPTSRAPVGPGTSSDERFKLSTNPRGGISMPRTGSGFPTGGSRNNASFNSPSRGSNRNTRGSRRGGEQAKDAQAAKTMPLTAGQELKPIAVTQNGWKPPSITKGASAPGAANASGLLEPEMVQRKVKAALNKMTPEKFDKIADQILLIASQSKEETDGRTLRQVIQLTFEKATDEAHWASMYAKFCKRMLETMSPEVRDDRIKDRNGQIVSGGNLFRKYLLNRCQEEFERGWAVNLPEKPDEEDDGKKTGEAALLSDEYYAAAAAKRRGLGLVQFIGELYKLGMLTERIMHECVHKLVDYKGVPDEAEIESLSKLLRTIGANLDSTEKGRPMMDAYFQRIQTMMDLPELPSRLKFMLLDVMDLRRANWVSKETNKGPKTLDEVRAEAEAAQAAKAQESARSNQRGGGRPPAGRGDARNFSGGYVQQNSNQVGMDDLRRLKGSANRTSSGNISLGPASMLSSRSNSGRRGPMPGGFLGPREDSTASSRSGTPTTRENTSHSNAFSLLANMDSDHPASPPSTSASPAMSKAVTADSDKKESE
jgi:translation initiation factor 4G